MSEQYETMSFSEAAAAVLRKAGEPLHYRELTRRILQQQLVATASKNPEFTVNALISVDLKRNGARSKFLRVAPGVFAFRQPAQLDSNDPPSAGSEEHRVKVPQLPSYDEVRLAIRVWAGVERSRITHLHSTLVSLAGTPQSPLDWSVPDEWIPDRLAGSDRELAEALWHAGLNPRHLHGHWLLALGYELLHNEAGAMLLTAAGNDFIDNPLGPAVQRIDEGEGLLKLLAIVAEKGPDRRSAFLGEWSDFLKNHSHLTTDGIAKDSLSRRLLNLVQRGLVSRSTHAYSITDAGLEYLAAVAASSAGEGSTAVPQIRELVKKHEDTIRASVHELLYDMDPIAFEHLVKRLLESMDYQNVVVTSPSNDKGVDVIGDIDAGVTSVREVVQVKRQRANVQRKVLDALRGSLHRFHAVRGTIITTSDFARGASEAAFETGAAPITLINGAKLVDLLIEHEIGVRKKSLELLELDPDTFAETEEDAGLELATPNETK